jgi:hypothetical protein
MHPNLDDLLALRDGDGPAGVARHVRECEACASRIEELRAAASALRALSAVAPVADHWPEIRRRAVAERRRRWMRRGAAVAASVLIAATAVVLTLPSRAPSGGAGADSDARAVLGELEAASRGLEAVLRDPGLQQQVLSPRRAAVIVDLEDRIAMVDTAIADQPSTWGAEENVVLWSRRVELLDALVAARVADIDHGGVGYAVFQYEGSQP